MPAVQRRQRFFRRSCPLLADATEAAGPAVGAMKLPPYGREFRTARQARQYVNPWVFAGPRAFELAARRGPGRLVLPAGDDPSVFDWSLVRGLDVVVRWPGASVPEVGQLGALLVRAGARSVLVLDDIREDGDRMVVVRPHRRFIAARRAAA